MSVVRFVVAVILMGFGLAFLFFPPPWRNQ